MPGKLAGAVISQTSGAPGGGISVQLRGPSSIIGNSEPLYIIDGVYANNETYDNGRSSNAFNQAGTIGQQSGNSRAAPTAFPTSTPMILKTSRG